MLRNALICVVVWLFGLAALAADKGSSAPVGKERLLAITLPVPQLERRRTVWIYLPPDYHARGRKRYPVLYMQDGQTLFEPEPPGPNSPIAPALARQLELGQRNYGTWRIAQRLDRLFKRGLTHGVLVVGIDSSDAWRLQEYSPWPWQQVPDPEGARYVGFLVNTVKPYIDSHYATLPGRAHTGIAGSSFGGTIALYAGLHHPEVFGKVAALSPVLTDTVWGPALKNDLRGYRRSAPMRIYIDLGTAEPEFGPLQPVRAALRAAGFADAELWFRSVPGGQHHVQSWGKRFDEIFLWLYRPGQIPP